jgi:O-antigen/teichoic acid export membrane protein
VRALFSDATVYGLASVADRVIGLLLLPLMTMLLSPSDYGIVSLFTTSAHLAFVLCSLCIHQAFLRHYTEAVDDGRRQAVINTSATLALIYWLVVIPPVLVFAEPLNRMIFGFTGSTLIYVLAALTIVEVFDALAGNRLQADGRPWALFWIRICGSMTLRTAGVVAVLLGAGAWGWILADALGRLLTTTLILAVAFRGARLRLDTKLVRPLTSYGAMLVPAMLSFYAMTVTDKFAIRALTESPMEQVGLYSVGERIAGIMHFVNLAFILGWQRFAYNNMHLPDGQTIIARGMFVFAVGGGFLAMTLSMLGDDFTHWIISPKFAGGIPVIMPLTIAAYFGGLASAAEVGLHKSRKPLTISTLNLGAAALNLVLNCVMIPIWGIAGAAAATMVSQGVRLAVVWRASQRSYSIQLDYRRLSAALGLFAMVLALGQGLRPFGWTTATIGQTLLIVLALLLVWLLPIIPADARRPLQQIIARVTGRNSIGVEKSV